MGNFIGHNKIIDNFSKRANNATISHAHLIVGEDGIGKSNLAKIFATKILGKEIDKDYVDIISYKSKKVSFGVDDIRDIIQEVNKKPFEGNKKVIIIHDGNKLTIQAQNALLKTIEEPPVGVYIILLCESLELILDTIRSRCQIYKLTPLSKSELEVYIKTIKNDIDNDEMLAILAYSEGIPGKAKRFLEDEKLKELRILLLNLLKALIRPDKEMLLDFEEKIIKYKENKEEILNILASFIRDIMFLKEVDKSTLIINGDKIEELRELTKELSYKKLNCLLEKIEEARKDIISNSNFTITIRVMIIGFTEG